jgi:hypothetical protein
MAREEPQTRFTSLMGLLYDPEGLRESFGRQDGRKAPGVDGIGKDDDGQGAEARLMDLSERIRRLGYRPLPVRRTYIPLGGRAASSARGAELQGPLGPRSAQPNLAGDLGVRALRLLVWLSPWAQRARCVAAACGSDSITSAL